MDIKTIKQLTQETQPYFFDEKTMQFFNQKLSENVIIIKFFYYIITNYFYI